MTINSTNLQRPAKIREPKPEPRNLDSQAVLSSTDSFNPGWATYYGIQGVVPLWGALANGATGTLSHMAGNTPGQVASGIGVATNLLGTATLVGNLLLGRPAAAQIGLGLLGLSGLTAAYAAGTA